MNGATPKGTIISKEFGDVYFSVEDGLAETRHVFIDSNNLPSRWQGRDHFTIAETGFGTGLNFLAAWQFFDETATPGQKLDFISFEKYPLSISEIREALTPWQFGNRLELFLENYPLRTTGFHKIILTEAITLTLIIGDINAMIPQLEASIDCWFLDGFKPSANPEMWTETVFKNMNRLSQPGTTFATFTAAGFVKRGLQNAGFNVRKIKGFGTKRDMLAGEKP